MRTGKAILAQRLLFTHYTGKLALPAIINFSMTTFEKLRMKIAKEHGINLHSFQRTYAGHWQKSGGAWVWMAQCTDEGYCEFMGSAYSATELLRSKSLIIDTGSFRGGAREFSPSDY